MNCLGIFGTGCCDNCRDAYYRLQTSLSLSRQFNPNEKQFLQLIQLFKKYENISFEKIKEIFIYCGKNYDLAVDEICDEFNVEISDLPELDVDFGEELSIIPKTKFLQTIQKQTGEFKIIKKLFPKKKFKEISHLENSRAVLIQEDYYKLMSILEEYKKINN